MRCEIIVMVQQRTKVELYILVTSHGPEMTALLSFLKRNTILNCGDNKTWQKLVCLLHVRIRLITCMYIHVWMYFSQNRREVPVKGWKTEKTCGKLFSRLIEASHLKCHKIIIPVTKHVFFTLLRLRTLGDHSPPFYFFAVLRALS